MKLHWIGDALCDVEPSAVYLVPGRPSHEELRREIEAAECRDRIMWHMRWAAMVAAGLTECRDRRTFPLGYDERDARL